MTYSKAFLLRDITTYSDDELVALVDGIRERRLRVATHVGKAKALSDQARRDRVDAALVKKSEAFHKKLLKINDAITEIENRLAEILALRLQLGESPDEIQREERIHRTSETESKGHS